MKKNASTSGVSATNYTKAELKRLKLSSLSGGRPHNMNEIPGVTTAMPHYVRNDMRSDAHSGVSLSGKARDDMMAYIKTKGRVVDDMVRSNSFSL